jgi:pimeloyl-[acyl-carrier protein] methyl ester esterase
MTARSAREAAQNPLWIERRGRGPALVLLHGWGLNQRVFDALLPQLALRHEVIGIDLPGHGRSAEPAQLAREGWTVTALARLLQAQLPAPATLLGWSLGGQVALELARLAPQQVRALVLVSSTPRFTTAPEWPHAVEPAVLERFAACLARDYRGTVHDFLELQVRGSRDASTTLSTLQSALLAHGSAEPSALARALTLLRDTDLRGGLATIRTPSLVLGGQYDRVTPPAASRALAAALPDAQHVEFARCGHAPFVSHEAQFGAAVEAFLARVSA